MAEHATLIVSQPAQRTLKVEISDGVTSIGRAHGNSIRLRYDKNVSRRHAAITPREDGYWLSDLTTRNGTTVNGKLVQSEHKLESGDLICLGGTSTIEFCSSESQPNKHTDSVVDAPIPEEAPTPTNTSASSSSVGESRQETSILTVVMLGVVVGIAAIAVFGGVLFATGNIDWGKSHKNISSKGDVSSQYIPTSPDDESNPAPSPPPEMEPTKEIVADLPPPEKNSSEVQTGDAQILAAKISPKNYRFDPAFVALIGGYVKEYKAAAGYYGRARKYRNAIDKEFLNVQGLPPMFGYVMAMSRTKFLETDGDVWNLPSTIVKSEGNNSSDTTADKTAGPTKVAASYTRGLFDVFGREGFMYAIACYGMTLDQAGKVQQQLELKDPTGEGRYDFWRMKNMGVVKGDQVELVARFFAAGIVIENPQQFGLSEAPLATLY